jgi:hypothetical protein
VKLSLPDSRQDAPGPSHWWKFYLRPVLHPRSPWALPPDGNPVTASVLPALIFLSVCFATAYWILSDEQFLRSLVSKNGTAANPEFEEAREAMERAIGNPALKVFVSLDSTLTRGRSVLSVLLLSSLSIAVLSGEGRWKEYLLASSFSTAVLSAGVIVQAIVILQTGEHDWSPSFARLLNSPGRAMLHGRFLNHLDVFSVWFLCSLAARLSAVSSERYVSTLTVVFGIWLILFSASLLLDVSFGFLL